MGTSGAANSIRRPPARPPVRNISIFKSIALAARSRVSSRTWTRTRGKSARRPRTFCALLPPPLVQTQFARKLASWPPRSSRSRRPPAAAAASCPEVMSIASRTNIRRPPTRSRPSLARTCSEAAWWARGAAAGQTGGLAAACQRPAAPLVGPFRTGGQLLGPPLWRRADRPSGQLAAAAIASRLARCPRAQLSAGCNSIWRIGAARARVSRLAPLRPPPFQPPRAGAAGADANGLERAS